GDLRLSAISRTAAEHRSVRDEAKPAEEPSATEPHSTPISALHSALARLMADEDPHLFLTVQEALVQQAFALHQGNQVQAAKLLGISRNTLRTLLKRHGLLRDATPESTGDDDILVRESDDPY
ncbi:MAG: Fis family transcriptional regulator, partial [Rhizobacter sp.]|nr:Fis family transcriptional regulator [Rhizobacter sp.]